MNTYKITIHGAPTRRGNIPTISEKFMTSEASHSDLIKYFKNKYEPLSVSVEKLETLQLDLPKQETTLQQPDIPQSVSYVKEIRLNIDANLCSKMKKAIEDKYNAEKEISNIELEICNYLRKTYPFVDRAELLNTGDTYARVKIMINLNTELEGGKYK